MEAAPPNRAAQHPLQLPYGNWMAQINNFGNTPVTFHQSLISRKHFGAFGVLRVTFLFANRRAASMTSSQPASSEGGLFIGTSEKENTRDGMIGMSMTPIRARAVV
jgi:hypothetical protein